MKRISEWPLLIPFSIALIIIGFVLLIWASPLAYWLGFSASTRPVDPTQEFVPGKTPWDLLQLLIAPFVLAAGGFWFSRQITRRDEREKEQQRIAEDRKIAEENTQQATLQGYLEKMSSLLLDKNLHDSEPESGLKAIARAWTLTVLQRLDGDRRGLLLGFLYESALISKDTAIISLAGAHLEQVHLEAAHLEQANLTGANLWEANLFGAHLEAANLERAYLFRAHLEAAHLEQANLTGANLGGAYLRWAYLERAHLEGANLGEAYLGETNLTGAHLERASLWKANLERANLEGAYLEEAYLGETNLKGATLRGAHLERAYLTGAHLERARYNTYTKWPEGFDPFAAGAILVIE